jgi:hypothetical protein
VRAGAPASEQTARGRSLKTQQRGYLEVDVISRRAETSDGLRPLVSTIVEFEAVQQTIDELDACRSKSSCIP